MIRIDVSGWMFILVPAHLGSPGQNPESRKTVGWKNHGKVREFYLVWKVATVDYSMMMMIDDDDDDDDFLHWMCAGVMKTNDLVLLFKENSFRMDDIRQYIVSLLQKFEVALLWDTDNLLIPSLLPTELDLIKNPALVYHVLVCCLYHRLFSSVPAKRLAGKSISEITYFMLSWMWNLNQVNHRLFHFCQGRGHIFTKVYWLVGWFVSLSVGLLKKFWMNFCGIIVRGRTLGSKHVVTFLWWNISSVLCRLKTLRALSNKQDLHACNSRIPEVTLHFFHSLQMSLQYWRVQ